MNKTLVLLAAAAMSASAFAQGTIIFANRNIPTLSGTGGGNENGTYNAPIWQGDGSPAGILPGGVTVGLFTPDGITLIGSTPLRTDALPSLNSAFFARSAQTLTVPYSPAGTTPALIVRAWQGSSFAAAAAGGGQFYEWIFTPKPLGGTPPNGGTPIPTPDMTGWGPESGAGLRFVWIPEPSSFLLGFFGLGLFLGRRQVSD